MVSDDADAARAPEDRSAAIAVTAFPVFILAGTILAFFFPAPFLPFGKHITLFLMIIMFGMGLTLTVPDFQIVARRPIPVIIGVIAQFVIMPLAALTVAAVLGLAPALGLGLLMLGSVPGGTSSNVITYLSRGDVALSVAMTSVSTLLSPIMTPMLMLLLADTRTDVDALGMALTLAQTVLLPVFGGLAIRYFFDRAVSAVSPLLPWVSIIGIGGVVFPTVATNVGRLAQVGLVVVLAVLLHNVLGYLFGYATGRLTGMPESQSRTLAVEVGTQSAGLASGMSAKFFAPEAALPGAVAAVLHNVTGAVYAAIARRFPTEARSPQTRAAATASV